MLLIVLSAGFFLLCDTIIFRSGLYNYVISPASISGDTAYFIRYEKGRPPSGRKDVLLTGDSKMGWGFSVKRFKNDHPEARFNFIQGALKGSTLKSYFYTLPVIDPSHNRYAAIVVPIAGYRITPVAADFENMVATAQALTPFLGIRDWYDLVGTYSDKAAKDAVTTFGLFPSHAFETDIQDLLLDPLRRVIYVGHRMRVGTHWDEDGSFHDGSMETLIYDRTTWKVSVYPPYFDAFMRKQMDDELRPLSPGDAERFTARNAEYMKVWLNRIAMLYAESQTRIVFIQIPSHPFPMPGDTALAGAPDVRDMLPKMRNIIVVDPTTFESLEQPRYFYDNFHLNEEGKKIFTGMLTDKIGQILAAP